MSLFPRGRRSRSGSDVGNGGGGAGGPGTCPTCGRPLDDHDKHVRFQLPDAVVWMPEKERRARTWETEVHMQVEGVGAYVRVLLPVRLTGGYTLTFGIWLEVPREALHVAVRDWWAPAYRDLVLDGRIANDVLPWGLVDRPARAVVRDPDHTPYVDSSADPLVAAVLRDEWPHLEVLDALPW